MAIERPTAFRLAIAGGLAAVALAAPVVATVTVPGGPETSHVACAAGESEDLYTNTCVPNLSSPFSTIPGNPDLPAIDGIPCGGRQSGQCIGLAEEQQAQTPLVQPHTSVSSSP